MDQIAKNLGISKTTVSRAISGKGRISTFTRERVWSYIQSNDFPVNTLAKGLATSKTYNIGLVIPSSEAASDVYPVHSIVQGVSEQINTISYHLIVIIADKYDPSEIIRLIKSGKVDGIILLGSLVDDEAVQYLEQEDFPFVVLGTLQNQNLIQIDYDHYMACKELTSMLLRKGLTKIAFIGADRKSPVNLARISGFQEAFHELNVELRTDLIVSNTECGVHLGKNISILLEKKVDAIISMTQPLCSSVVCQLFRQLDCSKEILIASMNNLTLTDVNSFTFAYLRFDAIELGRTAGKILLDLLDHRKVQTYTTIGYEIRLKEH
jgi:DNA-binding LacI/PurR family transcriptional regulator